LYLWGGTILFRTDGRHIDHIYLGFFAGQELEVAGRGTIAEQQHLPCGGELGVGQTVLGCIGITLPENI
jgi:hypothetical protein